MQSVEGHDVSRTAIEWPHYHNDGSYAHSDIYPMQNTASETAVTRRSLKRRMKNTCTCMALTFSHTRPKAEFIQQRTIKEELQQNSKTQGRRLISQWHAVSSQSQQRSSIALPTLSRPPPSPFDLLTAKYTRLWEQSWTQ